MKTITLTQGFEALVDDDDYERLSAYTWYARRERSRVYAIRHEKRGATKTRQMRMHRFVLGAADGQVVDHRNGNGLDNRKSNLRVCDNRENAWNSRVACIEGKTSRFKGVILSKGRWMARITVPLPGQTKGKLRFLGYGATEEAAARLYDDAAREHFGEFARLNFPERDREHEPPGPLPSGPILQLLCRRVGRSGFRGVEKCYGRWRATICAGERRSGGGRRAIRIGVFDDAESAARAYDAAARICFGERARLNFPELPPVPLPENTLARFCSPGATKDPNNER